MINVVYLVIFVIGGAGQSNGITSQSIPQANMAQCQANAKVFNQDRNLRIVKNGYSENASPVQKAMCIVGVK